jgi:hypothetical protein
MHRNHGGHAAGLAAAALQVLRIHVERIGLNVDEGGACPHVMRAVGAGDECHRTGHYGIPWADAGRRTGQVQRRGAAGHGDGVARADVPSHLLLELLDRTPLRQRALAQLPYHGLDIVLVEKVLAVGNHQRRQTVIPADFSACASKRDLTSMKQPCGAIFERRRSIGALT